MSRPLVAISNAKFRAYKIEDRLASPIARVADARAAFVARTRNRPNKLVVRPKFFQELYREVKPLLTDESASPVQVQNEAFFLGMEIVVDAQAKWDFECQP